MKKRGVTLIEAIVAIILMSIIALVGHEFIMFCQRFVNMAKVNLGGINRARESMEELCWEADPQAPEPENIELILGSSFRGERNITIEDREDYKKITVRVHTD